MMGPVTWITHAEAEALGYIRAKYGRKDETKMELARDENDVLWHRRPEGHRANDGIWWYSVLGPHRKKPYLKAA